jgi:hypothetical protein
MHQWLGSGWGAVNTVQIAPDFERPAGGENLRRADRAGVVEIHHFDVGMTASIAPYTDFIVLHQNLPSVRNSTQIALPPEPVVQSYYDKCEIMNVNALAPTAARFGGQIAEACSN